MITESFLSRLVDTVLLLFALFVIRAILRLCVRIGRRSLIVCAIAA